jgi:hypothetical protein
VADREPLRDVADGASAVHVIGGEVLLPPVFWVKMATLLLALVFTFSIRRRVATAVDTGVNPLWPRWSAAYPSRFGPPWQLPDDRRISISAPAYSRAVGSARAL